MLSINQFRLKIFVLLLFSIFLSKSPSYGKGPDWLLKMKNIKIFESSKEDVLKTFNYPKMTYSSNDNGEETSWGESVEYETNEGNLAVFYSTGKCSEETGNKGWDINKDIVVSVEFEPKKVIRLSELDLDLRTFTKYKESDNQYYQYQSVPLGINFTMLGKNVTLFEYSLTDKMKELDCEKVLKTKKLSTN